MSVLEETYHASAGSESSFSRRSVLFIGSESHDAPTITILQGLQELGFTVYTLKKWNINAWFCNTVIDAPDGHSFDFVLSNLHWGTRWQYYERYQLDRYPWVLIDGDDNRGWKSWRDKLDYYRTVYDLHPTDAMKDSVVSDVRWLEPLGSYEPDVVFVAQKPFGDPSSCYLPFGIQREYYQLGERKAFSERSIDLAYVDGPGRQRMVMRHALRLARAIRVLPGTIFSGYAQGEKVVAPEIGPYLLKEQREGKVIHAYFRWSLDRRYYEILNNARVLVYPGVDRYPFWDSKRPWEAYASGCFVLLSRPTIDVSEYPIVELSDFAVYDSLLELYEKYRYLYSHPTEHERMKTSVVEAAERYFTPVPLARYFLHRIRQHVL